MLSEEYVAILSRNITKEVLLTAENLSEKETSKTIRFTINKFLRQIEPSLRMTAQQRVQSAVHRAKRKNPWLYM